MARPTNEDAAEKRWNEVMFNLKANLPFLTKDSVAELRRIIKNDDVAVSNKLRAMENVFKLVQWIMDEESKSEAPKEPANPVSISETKDKDPVGNGLKLINF